MPSRLLLGDPPGRSYGSCSCPIYTVFSGIPPEAVIGLIFSSMNRATTFFICDSNAPLTGGI